MQRSAFSVFVVIVAAVLLAGCAAPARIDSTKSARRSVTELLALRPKDFNTTLTSRAGEAAVFEAEVASMRSVFALPDGAELEEKLPSALSAAAHFNVEKDLARSALLRALPNVAEKPAPYQRAVLSAAHTQFWNEAAPFIPSLLPNVKTPREFAIAAYVLLRSDNSAANKHMIAAHMQTNFPDGANEPRLRALDRRLRIEPIEDSRQRPALVDLLVAPIREGYPVVFSFQRRDRERAGLAMVRGADGRFVRNADGSYFTIAQLAMARTNLPGTITNGNTPQGVFAIKGTGTATNKWIGPTPFLESVLPFEASVALFEQREDAAQFEKIAWTEEKYESFLPSSWRGYFPIKEAFLAGQAGRDEILAHGNAVNPAYYRDEPFFPAAPSAGCLVAMEYWSRDDGTLVHSDQLALVKAFVSGGKDVGYLVVVEIDDRARAVALADVVEAVVAAETRGIRNAQ
jgi:outer membrane murein-binding lipoprotein Lpp